MSRVRMVASRLGWAHVLLWFCAAVGRRMSSLRLFVVLIHPFAPAPRSSPDAAGLETRFLTPRDVERFASDEDFRYSQAFANDALARGDKCFGILENGALLCYCWYADGPAPVFEDVEVAVDRPYVYGYNAYTDAAHRGRGLHRLGVCAAEDAFEREGARAFIAYIEADNLPPLIAAHRMGEEIAGFVFFMRLFGKLRWFATPGCRKTGFRVHRRPDTPQVPVSRLSQGQF